PELQMTPAAGNTQQQRTTCECKARRRALCRTTAGRNSLHGISTATVHFGENEVLKKTSCFAPKCHSSSGTPPAAAPYANTGTAYAIRTSPFLKAAAAATPLTATLFKVGRVAGLTLTPLRYVVPRSAGATVASLSQLSVAAMPVGVESF